MKYVMSSVEEADYIDFFRRNGHTVRTSYTQFFYNGEGYRDPKRGQYYQVEAECSVGGWWNKDVFVGRSARKDLHEATIAALQILVEALHLTREWEAEKEREKIEEDL